VSFANLKVAVGGKDNVLEGIGDRINMLQLHDAIASDAEQPKTEDIEHAFENFHSSRVIRKLIIECPTFAVTLWKKALKGKCKIWAHGHRYIVFAYCAAASKIHKSMLCLCNHAKLA
jgi:pumilio homology domain family member 6